MAQGCAHAAAAINSAGDEFREDLGLPASTDSATN